MAVTMLVRFHTWHSKAKCIDSCMSKCSAGRQAWSCCVHLPVCQVFFLLLPQSQYHGAKHPLALPCNTYRGRSLFHERHSDRSTLQQSSAVQKFARPREQSADEMSHLFEAKVLCCGTARRSQCRCTAQESVLNPAPQQRSCSR